MVSLIQRFKRWIQKPRPTIRKATEPAKKSFDGGNFVASPGGLSSDPVNQLALDEFGHFSGWVFASIKTIASRIAGQPFRISRKSKPEALILKHPLLDAINDPNPIFTRWTLLYASVACLELTGRCYWWIRENEEGKLEIWYLPPSWVQPQHTEERLYDSYRIRPLGSGQQFDLSPHEVLHFFYPDPGNPYLGACSPLQAQARAVLADESIQTAQHRAFSNGIHCGLALVVGSHPEVADSDMPGRRPHLTKDQRAQLITAVKGAYQGVDKYDEPLILDGLIQDIKKITQGPKEMDFANSSLLTKSRVVQGFGVNPISMGEIEGANYASAAVADQNFISNTVNPKIELISQTMTAWFGPYFQDDDLQVGLEPAKTRDPDSERADRQQLIGAGAITVNELRAANGLPPIADGDNLVSAGGEGGAGFGLAHFPGKTTGRKDGMAQTIQPGRNGFRNGVA